MTPAELKDHYGRIQKQREGDKAKQQNEMLESTLRNFRREQLIQRQTAEKSLLIEVSIKYKFRYHFVLCKGFTMHLQEHSKIFKSWFFKVGLIKLSITLKALIQMTLFLLNQRNSLI